MEIPWQSSGQGSVLPLHGALVQSLGQQDPLEKKWQPIPVFLRGEFYGQRSLAGYSPCVCKESDMTEYAHKHTILLFITIYLLLNLLGLYSHLVCK